MHPAKPSRPEVPAPFTDTEAAPCSNSPHG